MANAADMCLYLQCVLPEILFGIDDFRFLRETVLAPLMTPSRPTPSVDAVRDGVVSSQVSSPLFVRDSDHGYYSCSFFCSNCQIRNSFPAEALRDMYTFASTGIRGPVVHGLLLSVE